MKSAIPALALFAALAVTTAAHADAIVEVTEGFSVSNSSLDDTISSLTISYSGLNGIENPEFIGAAFASAPVEMSDVSVSSDAAAETITLNVAPNAFTISGSVVFLTVAATPSISDLQQSITEAGLSVLNPAAYNETSGPLVFSVHSTTAVPEPASSAMLGIGMLLGAGLAWERRRRAPRATDALTALRASG